MTRRYWCWWYRNGAGFDAIEATTNPKAIPAGVKVMAVDGRTKQDAMRTFGRLTNPERAAS